MTDWRQLFVLVFVLSAGCSEGEMVVAHYPDGQIESRGYQKGVNVKVGEWTFWYDNGQKRSEGRFEDGVKDGVWTYWSPAGERILSAAEDWQWVDREIADGITGTGLERRSDGRRAGEWTYRGFGDVLWIGEEDGPGAEWSAVKVEDGATAVGFVRDGRRVGLWTTLYESGKKRIQAPFGPDGVVEGVGVEWHENGRQKAAGPLVGGRRHGSWTTWHENGEKESVCSYDRGRRTGPWSEWHDNGTPSEAGQFTDGTPSGTWTHWDERGRKRREWIFDGASRDVVEYHDNGAVQARGGQIIGEFIGQPWWRDHGPWQRFYPDGQKMAEGSYLSGEENGPWTTWHRNGELKSRGSYENGSKTGAWSEWYEDGTLAVRGEWVDGVAADTTEWREGGVLREGWCDEKNFFGEPEVTGLWRAGRREGVWIYYHVGERKRAEGSYRSGRLSGEWKFWHLGGEMKAAGRFEAGKRVGRWLFWREDSSIDEAKSGVYEAGVRVTGLDK